ncbi:MAG: hypothetical protein V4538_01555 [Bacteroidota bacterium]
MKQTSKTKAKARLCDTVTELLLSKEAYMGHLADEVGVDAFTIKRQLKTQSPTLCLPQYLTAINKILKEEPKYQAIEADAIVIVS